MKRHVPLKQIWDTFNITPMSADEFKARRKPQVRHTHVGKLKILQMQMENWAWDMNERGYYYSQDDKFKNDYKSVEDLIDDLHERGKNGTKLSERIIANQMWNSYDGKKSSI